MGLRHQTESWEINVSVYPILSQRNFSHFQTRRSERTSYLRAAQRARTPSPTQWQRCRSLRSRLPRCPNLPGARPAELSAASQKRAAAPRRNGNLPVTALTSRALTSRALAWRSQHGLSQVRALASTGTSHWCVGHARRLLRDHTHTTHVGHERVKHAARCGGPPVDEIITWYNSPPRPR